MKVNRLKRVVAAGLMGIMMLSLCACGKKEVVSIEPMQGEEVYTLGFDFLGGKDVLPIGGYFGPAAYLDGGDTRTTPDHYTDEFYSLIQESGVNLLVYPNGDWQGAREEVLKSLELCEKYNVGIYLYDSRICMPSETKPPTTEEINEYLTEYCDYPAFCGVYVKDEPSTEYYHPVPGGYMSRYAPVYTSLSELGVIGSTNFYGILDDSDLGAENYSRYVKEYCDTCAPSYLCFDYYVWDARANKHGYFRNISIIQKYANENQIPWWCFIQAGGQWNDAKVKFDSSDLYPSEGQFKWNVNTALACGAKGISYFPCIQPWAFAYSLTEEFDFQRNGLIGAAGNKTQWFYYAKDINNQIRAIDSVLMNAVNKGVIVTSKEAKEDTKDLETVIKGTSWRELAGVEGDALIGCFNFQGRTALYVTNYERDYAQKITLNLQDTYNVSVTQNAEVSNLNTNKLVLDLKAGEGALVLFE